MGGLTGARSSLASTRQRFRNYRLLRRVRHAEPPHGVALATCHNEVTVRLMAGRLADAGIKSFVFVDELSTGAVSISGPSYVLVQPENESAARKALG